MLSWLCIFHLAVCTTQGRSLLGSWCGLEALVVNFIKSCWSLCWICFCLWSWDPLSICHFIVGFYGEAEVFVSSFIAVRGWVWFGIPKALGHPIPFIPMGAWLGRWDITVSVDISVGCEPSFLVVLFGAAPGAGHRLSHPCHHGQEE